MDVSEEEVEKAFRAMKANKAPGPSGVSSDLSKCADRPGMQQLTRVLQKIMDTEICPDKWKTSIKLPFFKGKGDPLQCSKYRRLWLLEHGMKVWGRFWIVG